MEEGEIHDTTAEAYDPSYEWPGESSTSGVASSSASISTDVSSRDSPYHNSTKTPCLRLIAITSSILPSRRKLVLLPDGYEQLQFGRDVGPEDTPRIRLKEMEVSKLHATVYWDTDRLEWGIVDMGSMHGTFIDPSPSSSSSSLSEASSMVNGTGGSADAGHGGLRPGARIRIRLSPSRVASVPRRLRHLDLLTIGSTSFSIHIHDDQLPCQECSPSGGDEIPLFSQKKGTASAPLKRARDAESDAYARVASLNPKKSLTALKRQLLTRHDGQLTGDSNAAQYLDRSARRRALNPGSHLDSPGVSLPSPVPAPTPETPKVDIAPSPPAPLPHTNIGHRLLMKQGWQPGTSLGLPDEGRVGLIEPLEVSSSSHRAGLGSRATGAVSGLNWKDREKQKRWDRVA